MGKGRTIAGLIYENYLNKRRRTLWWVYLKFTSFMIYFVLSSKNFHIDVWSLASVKGKLEIVYEINVIKHSIMSCYAFHWNGKCDLDNVLREKNLFIMWCRTMQLCNRHTTTVCSCPGWACQMIWSWMQSATLMTSGHQRLRSTHCARLASANTFRWWQLCIALESNAHKN